MVYDGKHIMDRDAESVETSVMTMKWFIARNSNCLELKQYI